MGADKFKNDIILSKENEVKPAQGNFWSKVKILARYDKEGGVNNKNKMGGDLNVNFISSEFIIPPSKEVFRKAVIFILAIIFNVALLIVLYLAIIVRERNSSKNLQNIKEEKLKVEEKIAEFNSIKEKMDNLKKNIIIAHALLDSHIYWDGFFKVLEKNTLEGVYFESADCDMSGQIKLDAIAADFDLLTEQVKVFDKNKEYFNSVAVSSINLQQDKKTGKIDGIKFFIAIEVKPEIFYKKLDK